TTQYALSQKQSSHKLSSFCLINTRSIGYKLPLLEDFVNTFDYSVVGFTETWISPGTVNDGMLSFNNRFTVYRADRDNSGGGVALLVSADLPSTLAFSHSFSPYCQTVAATTHFENSQFLICLVYRSPSCDHAFNNPSHHSNSLLALTSSLSLKQCVSDPTRGNNILDVVLTTHPHRVHNCRVLPPLPKLDHSLVAFSLDASIPRPPPLVIRDYRSANWDRIQYEIAAVDWDTLLAQSDQTPDALYSAFLDIIHPIINENVPYRKISSKPFLLPKKSQRLLRKSRKLFKHDKLKDNASSIPALIDELGVSQTDSQIKVDLLAHHFSKCFNHNVPPPLLLPPSLLATRSLIRSPFLP
ncbi:hypothetical protein PMAYCL1PPCAC_25221, partial [Pristionchus mayeri]